MRPTLALAILAAIPACAAGPLMDQKPRDLWAESSFPYFSPGLGEGLASLQSTFPGMIATDSAHTIIVGRRAGESAPWFSSLYAIDQLAGERLAGLYIGDIDYSTSTVSDSRGADGLSRDWDESGRTSWALDAWYVPKYHRVLRGFSLRASDRREASYAVNDDSLLDVGWERASSDSDATSGALGVTFLFAGPRNGFIRAALDFAGVISTTTSWYRPATSGLTEQYDGSRHTRLRLDGTVGYIRQAPQRGRTFLVNAGLHGGGFRAFSKSGQDSSWRSLDGSRDQMDSLGVYLEGAFTRHIKGERFEVFYGPSAYWHIAFDYASNGGSLVDRIRGDQRTDRGSIGIPALLRMHFSPRFSAFCSWHPTLTYTRSRQPSLPGAAAVREDLSMELTEGALGLCWSPIERLQFSFVPSLRDNILLSAIECRVNW